jgi:hypothetical protein
VDVEVSRIVTVAPFTGEPPVPDLTIPVTELWANTDPEKTNNSVVTAIICSIIFFMTSFILKVFAD